MKYEGFSAQGLSLMHDAVHAAIAMDEEAMKNGKTPPCGTNTYPDWREHAGGWNRRCVLRASTSFRHSRMK